MKTSSDVVKNTLGSYRAKHGGNAPLPDDKTKKPEVKKPSAPSQNNKIDISDKAKELAKASTTPASLATSVATNIATAPLKAALFGSGDDKEEKEEKVNDKKLEELKDEKKLKKAEAPEKILKVVKKAQLRKPGIFFIKGMEIFSSTDYEGLDQMAESIPGARVYSWTQKDDVIDQIKKRTAEQPIVLVGHSFGGDTAHEIAEELNTLENGFRSVDLLVTVDSVGSDNDIVSQNVKKNMNFFGEKSWFLNDSPNVARNNELTNVINELRVEEHTDLDNSNDIQFKIVTELNSILK